MSARKTPVLLRRGPLSGDVHALLRYTRKSTNGREILQVSDKQDVTADFDHLMLEELFGVENDSPDIIAILDGVADGDDLTDAECCLTDAECCQVRAFRERLKAAVERYNARLEEA